MDETSPTGLPFEDLRVLEFCHTVMGPCAGLLLADMGADVIKIEPAPDGDRTRKLRGFGSGFFYALNRNKKSLAIDLKTKQGQALAHRLAEDADIVLENYGPGTMEKLGCGYEELRKRNPRLIYCALKGFLSGPYEHRPALDEVVQFMAGLAYMTGPVGKPMRAGASIIDMMGGMFAVIAVQAALRDRERTGKGQLVKSALFETCAFAVAQHMAAEAISGERPLPMAARRGAWGIYDVFDTADEQIFVAVTSDSLWRRFCEGFELPELLNDARFRTNEDRVHNRPELLPIVVELLGRHTSAEVGSICDQAGVPFAPVAHPGDLFDDPHLKAGGRMVEIAFPNGVSRPIPGLPIEMEGRNFGLRRPTPTLSQDMREILMGLGVSDGEVDDLVRGGVVIDGG